MFFSGSVLHLVNFLRIRCPSRLLERGDFYLVVVSYYFNFRGVPLALFFFQPLFFQFLCFHFRHGLLLETVCFSELDFVFFKELSQLLCLLRLLYLHELVCLLLASPLIGLALSLELLSALGLCDVFHALFFEQGQFLGDFLFLLHSRLLSGEFFLFADVHGLLDFDSELFVLGLASLLVLRL